MQIKSQGGNVLRQLLGILLKGDEDTGFIILDGPPDQELHGKEGLAAAGGPGHEGGSAFWQAAPGDLVLTMGAGDVTDLGPEILARLSQ